MNRRTRLLGRVGAVFLIVAIGSVVPGRAEAAGPVYRLRNWAYDQCMASPELRLNVVLRILPCSGTGAGYGKWNLEPKYYRSGNSYRMHNVDTHHCAEVNQGTAFPGELVDDFTCNWQQEETWERLPYQIGWDTYYQFRHAGTNLCLDTVGGPGSQLMQWPCDVHSAAQLWKVEQVG